MKTLLLIWSLVLGHCLAGPFFFGQQGVVAAQASSEWTPPTTSNLALWLDAPRETAYADGDTVTSLSDWSGNGHVLTQATATKRGTWNSNVVNGLAVYRLDGTDDEWTATTGAICDIARNVGAISVYWVAKPSLTGARAAWGWTTPLTTAGRAFGGAGATSRMRLAGRRLDADSLNDNAGAVTVSTSVFQVYSAVFDWSNSDLYGYINGTNQITNTSFLTSGLTQDTASAAATIGRSTPAIATYFGGDIVCLLIYQAAHDTSTRQGIENSLITRCGL